MKERLMPDNVEFDNTEQNAEETTQVEAPEITKESVEDEQQVSEKPDNGYEINILCILEDI